MCVCIMITSLTHLYAALTLREKSSIMWRRWVLQGEETGKDAASTYANTHTSASLTSLQRLSLSTHGARPLPNLSISIFLYPPSTNTHTNPHPPVLYESEGSLHLLQDAANHLCVRACVWVCWKKRAQKVAGFMHLLCQTHIRTQTNTLLHTQTRSYTHPGLKFQ